MEVKHPTVILKAVYVLAVLLGSIMFGYGLLDAPANDPENADGCRNGVEWSDIN